MQTMRWMRPARVQARGKRLAVAAKSVRQWIPIAALAACGVQLPAQQPVTVRTPATPLVVHDPYFSLWSFDDTLNAGPTRHWTGVRQQLNGIVRIDGKPFRFMGDGRDIPGLPQVSRAIWPTRTIYDFEGQGVHLTATFLTPALTQNLDVLSRPLTYLTWSVRSSDGQPHAVRLSVSASAQLAVDNEHETVVWGSARVGDMTVLRVGDNQQPVLQKAGDNLRIDWGWAVLAVPAQPDTTTQIVGEDAFLRDATSGHPDAAGDDLDMPRAPRVDLPAMTVDFDLPSVSADAVTRRVMLAYDYREAVEYLHRQMPDYWRHSGQTFAQMLEAAERDEGTLRAQSESFDSALASDLAAIGGAKYAQLAILAYRQTLGAHKLVVDIDGQPLLFSKENSSNGCTDTVDVTYPASPYFLLFNPKLLEAELRPVMEYASLPRWPWPFAPHDIGTFPLANGQVYGGGERTEDDQMPVEETGNMLIMFDALAKAEGSPAFAAQYWPLLARWADYLLKFGMDPENQLSTDDFTGHLTHNANLSIKAILALGAYAQLADQLHKPEGQRFRQSAQQMATQWLRMAADGDHTRLAFDLSGTWSQKYNLVWDRILGLNLFSESLVQSELHYYLQHQNAFGLPLDNRHTYTKLDWSVWTATMAPDRQEFDALIDPLYKFMTETPTRVPLSDWFDTVSGAQVGFQARSVVGGVYIKMLTDPQMWRKWSAAQPAGTQ